MTDIVPTETPENANMVGFDEMESSKTISLTKAQLKALGIQYKAPQTDAQQARNQRLSELQKARHAKQRQEKEQYERQQLQMLQSKIKASVKPKQKYIKQKIEVPLNSEESDDESKKDYEEFLKFKKSQQKAKQQEPKPEAKPESDDEFIQKKTAKATKILETVNKLDNAINKISGGNPYMDFFNKTRQGHAR